MEFGIIINRNLVDRNASEPHDRLYRYLDETEELRLFTKEVMPEFRSE